MTESLETKSVAPPLSTTALETKSFPPLSTTALETKSVAPPLLETRSLTCRWPGGVVAVKDVSMAVAEGSLHAVLGENGAGKSTLMKAIFGLLPPVSGMILWKGQPIRLRSAADALALGIGMVHQHFQIIPSFSVWETIVLGQEPRKNGQIDKAEAFRRLEALMARTGLSLDLEAPAESLSIGQKQRLEIIKALSRDIRLLILDEPTAVLAPQEIEHFFQTLRSLQKEGITILFITHKLREVQRWADHVTILRRGEKIEDGPIKDFSVEAMASSMVGHPVEEIHRPPPLDLGPVRLSVQDLRVEGPQGRPAVQGIRFEIRAGEIVGIAGVEGNGQRELFEAILGLRPIVSGQIRLCGEDVAPLSTRQRFQLGLGHVSEDRQATGVVMEQSVQDNLFLGRHRDASNLRSGLWRDQAKMQTEAAAAIQAFGITPADADRPIRSLSGGNQQKVVIAREVQRHAKLLLVAHPTRGVDIGAIATIHQTLFKERERSAAILLISSELTEILALSDRILVLFEGRITGEFRPQGLDETALGLAMLGS